MKKLENWLFKHETKVVRFTLVFGVVALISTGAIILTL